VDAAASTTCQDVSFATTFDHKAVTVGSMGIRLALQPKHHQDDRAWPGLVLRHLCVLCVRLAKQHLGRWHQDGGEPGARVRLSDGVLSREWDDGERNRDQVGGWCG